MITTMKRGDIICSIVLIAFSTLAYRESYNFTESAAMVPRLVLGCIIIFATSLLVKAFIKPTQKNLKFEMGRIAKSVLAVIGYAVFTNIIGFYAATMLYLSGAMYMFGVRSKKALIGVPIGFILFVYVCFVRFLSLNPPMPFFLK